jgi:hypothetical protein
MSGTLIVHAGGIKRTRDELREIPTPGRTETWTPVPHYDLATTLAGSLGDAGILVEREQYATLGRDAAKLFGVLDLRIPSFAADDYRMAVGVTASNDKSMAIRVIAAARVFVCDNLAFSGSGGAVMLRKVHSAKLDIAREMPGVVDRFLEKSEQFRVSIDEMKASEISDDRAKHLLHDAFAARPILPIRLFPRVSDLYFNDGTQQERFPGRTMWALNNAFTEAAKSLRPGPQSQYGQRIGQFFARSVRERARAHERAIADLATV